MKGFFRIFQPIYSKILWLLPQSLTDVLFYTSQKPFLHAASKAGVPCPAAPKDPFFSFVVLQYNHPELTRRCIQSINKLPIPGGKSIVIVDNGSTDGAGDIIEKEFEGSAGIQILRIEKNLGFARGNNEGYKLARRIREPDFLCLVNSDIVFPSPDFAVAVAKEYSKSRFSVLGPDLQPPGRLKLHQNPMRLRFRTIQEAGLILRRLEEELALLKSGCFVPPPPRRPAPGRPVNSIRRQGAIVLHGAAYILSRAFLDDVSVPFDDRTFMYGEEEIFCLRSYLRGHRLVYTPRIRLLHDGEGSSADIDPVPRRIFRNEQSVQSIKIFIDIVSTDEKLC